MTGFVGRKRILCLILACLMGLTGCAREETAKETEPTAAQNVTEEPRPEPAAVGDGNPDSLLCKASYTAPSEDIQDDKAVAVMGENTLTLGQLQIRYYLAVDAYLQSGAEPRPETGIGLEYQPCPLEEGLSWQHYFLKDALEQWVSQQALLLGSAEKQEVSDEYFEPNSEWHTKYLIGELPPLKYLYETKDGYTPNSMHQAWLDSLPDTLLALAKEKGCVSLTELIAMFAGHGASEADLLTVAEEVNRSYMYFTEKSFDFDLSAASGADFAVDIRHCLLIPEDSEDPEKSIEICWNDAEKLMRSWEGSWQTARNREANFARMTKANSQDEASRLSGGLYTGIHQGQLIAPLDAWCFDGERQPGDVTILQSEQGIHILFFCGAGRDEEKAAELLNDAGEKLVKALTQRYPVSIDYSAICLGTPEGGAEITMEEFLYPDVAHERFPEPILYFQADFPRAPYGIRTVGKGGCGITTLAMLTTYMTDEIHTPSEMAKKYRQYSLKDGTDGSIFLNVPEEFGYFFREHGNNWDMVVEALEEGRMVVSLQYAGYFTSAGHFLLLWQLNDDGTVKIRDSNIINYGKLDGFKTDSFTREQVMGANGVFYVFEKKITSYPECSRCGSGENSTVLAESYLCEKCAQALLRREGFLSLRAGKVEPA